MKAYIVRVGDRGFFREDGKKHGVFVGDLTTPDRVHITDLPHARTWKTRGGAERFSSKMTADTIVEEFSQIEVDEIEAWRTEEEARRLEIRCARSSAWADAWNIAHS